MDSRDCQITLKDELECLELILGSDAILIWGNHDLAYTLLRPKIAAFLNEEFRRESKISKKPLDGLQQSYGAGPLFAIDWTRSGDDDYGGIFWYDQQHELAVPDPRVKQIFGHSPVAGPLKRDAWNNINIESGYWVFDTEVQDFVLLK